MGETLKYIKTYDDLKKSKLLKETLSEDDKIYVIDENRVYSYRNGRFVVQEIDKTSNVDVSLYDINKQIISQMPEITKEEAIKILDDYQWMHASTSYFGFMSFEKHYFTIFHRTENKQDTMFAAIALDCIQNIGHLKTLNIENETLEVWLDIGNEIYQYLIFPYDEGIVNFHG